MLKVLKEKLLRLLSLIKKKKIEKKLDPEVERILDKLAEETVRDPRKEQEILEALEGAKKKIQEGDEINACSRNPRGNLLSSAETRL